MERDTRRAVNLEAVRRAKKRATERRRGTLKSLALSVPLLALLLLAGWYSVTTNPLRDLITSSPGADEDNTPTLRMESRESTEMLDDLLALAEAMPIAEFEGDVTSIDTAALSSTDARAIPVNDSQSQIDDWRRLRL